MDAERAKAIEIRSLTHAYKGRIALSAVSFSVDAQSIHGFVGPNGAGKTTTLKVLATLLRVQRGSVRVFSRDVVPGSFREVRRRIGFMPDHFSMYRQMTVFEYLDFFAAAYGMGLSERDRVVASVLALTDMAGRKDDLIKSLSRGMQQRVGLARVLVHDPSLLLLDEPASGLDPRARIELMEILKELKRLGKTIFISSHILSELAELCDAVTILDKGVVKYTGSMAGLLSRDGDGTSSYLLSLAADAPAVSEALLRLDGIVSASKADGGPSWRISFRRDRLTPSAVLRAVLDASGEVVSFAEDRRHLNEAFLDLTEPGVRP